MIDKNASQNELFSDNDVIVGNKVVGPGGSIARARSSSKRNDAVDQEGVSIM